MKLTVRCGVHLVALGLGLGPWTAAHAEDSQPKRAANQLRIGISTNIVRGVNENDARAAMRGWTDAFMRESPGDVEYTTVLASPDDLTQAVRRHQVDAVALTLPEYVLLKALLDPKHVIVDMDRAKDGERYLILARADSNIRTPGDLKGRSLVVQDHSSTSLALAWLDTLLEGEGLSPKERLFSRLTMQDKLSRGVILPVFFRQADACLVTRRGFNAMAELNPQVGRQLRAVATSPAVVPSVMTFHKDCPARNREDFQNRLLSLFKGRIGDQMQTLFQSSRFTVTDASFLQPSQDLLARAERLKARTGSAGK